LGIASIVNGPEYPPEWWQVAFSQLANPGNLPGGEILDPDFVTTDGFSADIASLTAVLLELITVSLVFV